MMVILFDNNEQMAKYLTHLDMLVCLHLFFEKLVVTILFHFLNQQKVKSVVEIH
jgi:hypothetical protein